MDTQFQDISPPSQPPAPIPLQQVSLRTAVAADRDWAVPLLFASDPALFSYIFAARPEEAQTILQQAFVYPGHAFSYEYTQVVEVAEQPVGLVIAYPGEVKRTIDDKVHRVMAKILSLRQLPKILVNVADLSRIKQDVPPQDYYILSMSIVPAYRGRGLGSLLIQDAEAQARADGYTSVCLDVTYSNHRAKALFERHGYQVVCSKATDRFNQMTRAGGIHRLAKPLN